MDENAERRRLKRQRIRKPKEELTPEKLRALRIAVARDTWLWLLEFLRRSFDDSL